jgi:hypothetical protein
LSTIKNQQISTVQTCSAITENVSKVSRSLTSLSQDVARKPDSTNIENIINNNLSTKFVKIGSDVTKSIQQEAEKLSQSQSQLHSILTDKLTSAQNVENQNSINILNKISEVKDIQQKSLKDLLGSHNSAITSKITEVDKSLSEIIKQKSDDIQAKVTKSMNDRITALESNLHISLTGKEANITNDVNSRTFNMSERITEVETAMSKGMMSLKDDLASEIAVKLATIESAMNTKITDIESSINTRMTTMESSLNSKISNLTSMLHDFIKSSTQSSNKFESELRDRMEITNYKIDKSSIIQDYSKSMLIGSCALLVTLVLCIIYKKILFQSDDVDEDFRDD